MERLTQAEAAAIRRGAEQVFTGRPRASIDDVARSLYRKVTGRIFAAPSAEKARRANLATFCEVMIHVLLGRLDALANDGVDEQASPSAAIAKLRGLREALEARNGDQVTP